MGRIGIMAAMRDELVGLLTQMQSVSVRRVGMRDFHEGYLHGLPCVAVLARIGKVAAAATAVTLIREFGVDRLIFTGLAGGVAEQVRVGDVVIGARLLQHDMDARPLFPRYEVPLLGCSHFQADPSLSELLQQAATAYLSHDCLHDISLATRNALGLSDPQVHTGLILSGDQFVGQATTVQALLDAIPDALCVEMEGAAVAQVCYEYSAQFAIIRTISDRADDTAGHDFDRFLRQIASHYSAGILRRLMNALAGAAVA